MSSRTYALASLFVLSISCSTLAQEFRISALPTRFENRVTPELRVREFVENGQRRLALIATVVMDDRPVWLFNPFGNHNLGSPYRIVLTDSKWKILHTIVEDSSGLETFHKREYWLRGGRGGIVGRCYWTHSPGFGPDDRSADNRANLSEVPAGRYSLFLLVTKRIVHDPPEPNKVPDIVHRWRESWNDHNLDKPYCVSAPVNVDVDEAGAYWPIPSEGIDGRFEAFEADASRGQHNILSISSRLVNPHDAWLVIPELNIFLPTDNPMHVFMHREDGAKFDRFSKLRGSTAKHAHPKESDCVFVPRDGVIGGSEPRAGVLDMPGKYFITTEINESIYKDKLFVDGKRVIRKPDEWPVAFRSKTMTITVPEKAP